jgi:2'-5' RNA ligase
MAWMPSSEGRSRSQDSVAGDGRSAAVSGESAVGIPPPAGRRRWRLAVAVVFDPPVRDEIDGLRRGLGDTRRERIAPHITLVPPVNLNGADLPAALDVLRRAASRVEGPLELTLGPVGTFAPRNAVVYLGVGGDLENLRRLRTASGATPLDRQERRPWVPHVTLATGVADARIDAAIRGLQHYAAVAATDRVVLLSEFERRWTPLADATLGPPAIIGTGGLALELTESRIVGPDAAVLAAKHGVAVPDPQDPSAEPAGTHRREAIRALVFTARRDGTVLGAARAWTDGAGGHVGVLVDEDERHQGVGTHLLAATEHAVLRQGWGCDRLAAVGPAAFYEARSAYSKVTDAAALPPSHPPGS